MSPGVDGVREPELGQDKTETSVVSERPVIIPLPVLGDSPLKPSAFTSVLVMKSLARESGQHLVVEASIAEDQFRH